MLKQNSTVGVFTPPAAVGCSPASAIMEASPGTPGSKMSLWKSTILWICGCLGWFSVTDDVHSTPGHGGRGTLSAENGLTSSCPVVQASMMHPRCSMKYFICILPETATVKKKKKKKQQNKTKRNSKKKKRKSPCREHKPEEDLKSKRKSPMFVH